MKLSRRHLLGMLPAALVARRTAKTVPPAPPVINPAEFYAVQIFSADALGNISPPPSGNYYYIDPKGSALGCEDRIRQAMSKVVAS